MVKARIGKTEIEGTPEEVAQVLNGLLTAQEEDTNVEVIHTATPETEENIRAYVARLAALPPRPKQNNNWHRKITAKHRRKIKYRKFLGCTLDAWLTKNYPNLANGEKRHNNKDIITALRIAGIPYHISKIKIGHSIDSVRHTIKKNMPKPEGYTKDEVEEINQDID